jgi:hypothetical protein
LQRRLIRAAAGAALLLGATAAPAATRGYSVTSFDRIRVEGPFDVTVRTGVGSSGRADGPDRRMLDRVRIEVIGRTLVIRRDQDAASGGALTGIRIAVSTPAVTGATVLGTGMVTIDSGRGARFDVAVSGAGSVSVAALDIDLVNVTILGSGTARLAGRARQVRASVQGAGTIAATPLSTQDATITMAGTGTVALTAIRTARITASGAGAITISGTPACTVQSVGTVEVRCGH